MKLVRISRWKSRKFVLIFCCRHGHASHLKMRRGPNLARGPGFADHSALRGGGRVGVMSRWCRQVAGGSRRRRRREETCRDRGHHAPPIHDADHQRDDATLPPRPGDGQTELPPHPAGRIPPSPSLLYRGQSPLYPLHPPPGGRPDRTHAPPSWPGSTCPLAPSSWSVPPIPSPPPARVTARQNSRPTQLAGFHLPPRSFIVVSPPLPPPPARPTPGTARQNSRPTQLAGFHLPPRSFIVVSLPYTPYTLFTAAPPRGRPDRTHTPPSWPDSTCPLAPSSWSVPPLYSRHPPPRIIVILSSHVKEYVSFRSYQNSNVQLSPRLR